MRKGEIACYKQFLLLSQCFPQLCIFSESKCSIFWYGLKALQQDSFFSHHWPLFWGQLCGNDDGYIEKEPVARKEYYASTSKKEPLESIDRYTDCRDIIEIIEIMLESVLSTTQSVFNQCLPQACVSNTLTIKVFSKTFRKPTKSW